MEKIHEHDPSKHVFYIEDFEDIASFVYERAGAGDLVLTMGAGDINTGGKMILDMDAARIELIRKPKEGEYKKIED